ncbi:MULTISPECIES: MarC family protein [unclassified Bradyrhizobium]|uniref:MarC family protein n=1 Tax=unclassified Bradyrhizobium TaxID=2631580 RepID=UPI0024785B17|nr:MULTISPECIES: MarC family protein [unclassified Bradyrhizobium]WGR73804.1 NAAT family transporter [Bradyrhizobium sp. ISRA426]WGR78641.1 NAAT family transporter [Bradyrhizobium sp. ISRA430]WGR89043.1 NAAT family transporter [Bradyrhizobium sp. ISRA432]
MNDLANAFLLVFAGLFPVVNPIGAAPLFLRLTAGCTERERGRLAFCVAFNGFWLLLGTMLFGSFILEFFGITAPVVRIAGGLLVAAMGWQLLNDDSGSKHGGVTEAGDVKTIRDGFYPLTLPLTVGPGSISVALTMGSHRPHEFTANAMLLAGSALVGLLAVALAIYCLYRLAAPMVRHLGPSGVNVLMRLAAFIRICIGIQIAWSGARVLMSELQRAPGLF